MTKPTGRTAPWALSLVERLHLVNDRQDIVLGHDQILIAVKNDFVAGVGREQHAIALLDLEGSAFAVVQKFAVAHAQDLALLGLFLGGVGKDNTARRLFLGFQTLDQNLVVEWYNVHARETP